MQHRTRLFGVVGDHLPPCLDDEAGAARGDVDIAFGDPSRFDDRYLGHIGDDV